MLNNLSFCRFKACFAVQKPVELPPYTGSTFRGALGHGLRKVRYGMKGEACSKCMVRSRCRYGDLSAYLFESPADHPFIAENRRSVQMKHETYPQPFILDPPAGGLYLPEEFLPLSFTLVGKAIECFPFMACGLSHISYIGIPQNEGAIRVRGRISLEAIVDGIPLEHGSKTLIYDGKTGRMVGPGQILDFDIVKQWVTGTLNREQRVEKVCVRFLSPFRYKNENRLGKSLTFEVFMRNVFRRLTLLSVHSPLSFNIDFKKLLSAAESVKTENAQLRWCDWERRSARQKDKMKLGGFVGDIVFSGQLTDFLPYIKLCEFLNVGKNGAFGLGRYEVAIDGRTNE